MGFFHCHWYVTTRCNSRCSTCSIWRDSIYKSKESTLQSRLDLLQDIKSLGFKSIDFTGGEPLLYKGLPILIREAKKMGFFTSLTTNGTLYPKYAQQLKGNLSSLSFSLDSADRETHNTIRGIDCFDNVIRSIILARKLGETVMLKTTVTNKYIETIPPLIKLAARMGVLIELNAEFEYFENEKLSKENIKRMYKWWKHPNVIISHAHLQFMRDGGNHDKHSLCPIGKKVLVIAPDNNIYSPCMHRYQEILPLIDKSLVKTINNPDIKANLLWAGNYYFCRNCTIPCYFEAMYYTRFTKYLPICLWSRIGYLRKRLILELKNKIDGGKNNEDPYP
jgi:MoaA/NifB/PqqE/SkfB family radical SAM enzyme